MAFQLKLPSSPNMSMKQIEAPHSRSGSTTDLKQDPYGSRPQSSVLVDSGSIEVPTATPSVSSGFPYNQRLFNLHVPPTEWKEFSQEVVEALKLTTFETLASWTVGVSVGIISSLPLLIFGAAPGYYAGKAIKDKSILQKVHEQIGDLVAVLSRWNDTFFRERGLIVRLALPKKLTGELKAEGDEAEKRSLLQKMKTKVPSRSKGEKTPAEIEKRKEQKLASHYRMVIETIGDADTPDNASRGLINVAAPSYSARVPPAYKGGEAQELEGGRERSVVEAPGTQIHELA